MAEVPAHYIKDKQIDYPAEIFSALGDPVECFGLRFRPLSAGVLSLLELIDSQVWHKPMEATVESYVRFFSIVAERDEIAAAVKAWVDNGRQDGDGLESKLDFDKRVIDFFAKHENFFSNPETFVNLASNLISNAFTGYEMIPDSANTARTGPYLFGAFFIASTISLFVRHTGCTMHEAVWSLPITLAGHLAAGDFLRSDSKGVGISRPKDPADVKHQLKLANEREERGELHPWQIDPPRNRYYEPTKKQKEANPEIYQQWLDNITRQMKEATHG